MKLLIDMNLSPRWVEYLAASGITAAHWSTLGAITAPDQEIMTYAEAHDFVVFTHDLDFSAILAATQGRKPSVLQLRSEDVSPESIGQAVVDAVRQMAAELAEGALISIDVRRARLRLLPLARD